MDVTLSGNITPGLSYTLTDWLVAHAAGDIYVDFTVSHVGGSGAVIRLTGQSVQDSEWQGLRYTKGVVPITGANGEFSLQSFYVDLDPDYP